MRCERQPGATTPTPERQPAWHTRLRKNRAAGRRLLRIASGTASEGDTRRLQEAAASLMTHHGSAGQHGSAKFEKGANRNMWQCYSCQSFVPLGKLSCPCGRTPSSRTTKPEAATTYVHDTSLSNKMHCSRHVTRQKNVSASLTGSWRLGVHSRRRRRPPVPSVRRATAWLGQRSLTRPAPPPC